MKPKEMRRVANRIRKRLEKIATMLHSYTLPHLGGLCGYGSLMLYNELLKLGRKPQIATGGGHWFVVCDEMLVDVTASQFGQPKVVVKDYATVKEQNGNNEYQRTYWNAYSIGTPKEAGIDSLQIHLDKTMEQYKSRKPVAPTTSVVCSNTVTIIPGSTYIIKA